MSLIQRFLQRRGDMVAEALSEKEMLSEDQKSRAYRLIITYETAAGVHSDSILLLTNTSMPRSSPADPQPHSTIWVEDARGHTIATAHVATDAGKQQVPKPSTSE